MRLPSERFRDDRGTWLALLHPILLYVLLDVAVGGWQHSHSSIESSSDIRSTE